MKGSSWKVAAALGLLLITVTTGGCDQSFAIELKAGQNVVVYPGTTAGVEDATAAIRDDLKSVGYWDGSGWLRYTPSPSYDDLDTLVTGETYSVLMKAARTWIVPK